MRSLPAALLLFGILGCGLPRDPEDTFERVRGGMLRVGITANPPWTTVAGGRYGGIEAALVRQLSEEFRCKVEWTSGSEAELMERLHEGQLDLVIGGLNDESPWTTHAGFTRPFASFAKKQHVMAVRQGENRWLLELDKFLQSRRDEIRRVVNAEAAQ